MGLNDLLCLLRQHWLHGFRLLGFAFRFIGKVHFSTVFFYFFFYLYLLCLLVIHLIEDARSFILITKNRRWYLISHTLCFIELCKPELLKLLNYTYFDSHINILQNRKIGTHFDENISKLPIRKYENDCNSLALFSE